MTPPPRSPTDIHALSVLAVPEARLAGVWPAVWWVGCHGGSGSSTLARLTDLGCDLGAGWPSWRSGYPMADVWLVCRASAMGTWAAVGAVEQWRRRSAPPHVRVRGLAAVAASPKRPPRIVAERLHLLAGWVPVLHRVGWQETLLAADDPRDIGVPPDVAALHDAVLRSVTTEDRP